MADKPRKAPVREIIMHMAFKHCELPPVQDALVLGKRAPVGSNGVVRALQALSPGQFKLIKVEHPVIEVILVRESDLRKVPEDMFVEMVLEHAGPIMDESDALNVTIDLSVTVKVNARIAPQ